MWKTILTELLQHNDEGTKTFKVICHTVFFDITLLSKWTPPPSKCSFGAIRTKSKIILPISLGSRMKGYTWNRVLI